MFDEIKGWIVVVGYVSTVCYVAGTVLLRAMR